MAFDGEKYTNDSLIEELLLIERHCKDGSAAKAHCSCIQDKHMKTVIALAKEGKPLTKNVKLKGFYESLQAYGEKRLQSIYDLIKSEPSMEEEISFYNVLSDEIRLFRVALENEDLCGCVGCPLCKHA